MPPLSPLPPVGPTLAEVVEGDPGTNVELGLEIHDSAAADASTVAAPEFNWAFPPKSQEEGLRLWLW